MIKFLNSPYPFYESNRHGLRICLGIGIFIAAFCLFIQPFGLDQVSAVGRFGYGLVSFIICSLFILIFPMIWPGKLRMEGWTVLKEIIWISAIVMALAIANYFYSGLVFNAGFGIHIESFLIVLAYTLLVAMIPAVAIILYKQLIQYKKVINEVENMENKLNQMAGSVNGDQGRTISISSESGNDKINIQSNNFVYAASAGNYVEIFYRNDGHIKKHLVRNRQHFK